MENIEKSLNHNEPIQYLLDELSKIQELRGFSHSRTARLAGFDYPSFYRMLDPNKTCRKPIVDKLCLFINGERRAKCEARNLLLKRLGISSEEMDKLISDVIHFNGALEEVCSRIRMGGTMHERSILFYLNELIHKN